LIAGPRIRAARAATAGLAVAALFFLASSLTEAQTTASPVEVVPVLVDATRIESWSFFTPRPGGGDPDYTLAGNRATLGVAAATPHFEGYGAFQYAQLLNLPETAVNPGPLGPGAFYYDAARAPNAYQLYFKALSLRVRRLGSGVSFEVGRMGFNSSAEAPAASPDVESLARERLHGRLIGEVRWSAFERTFDGARVDVAQPRWHATAAMFFPSQGGYEESANATISDVRVATASITLWGSSAARPDVGPIARIGEDRQLLFDSDAATVAATEPAFEAQAFAEQYRDRRMARTRPDNNGLPAEPVDVSIATFGGSLVTMFAAGHGRADAVAWVAGQTGDWYGDRHRAWSAILEGGYRWRDVAWQPWARGGMAYASGDENQSDFKHGTFFPGLPSSRPDLLAGTFAQMNLRDVFAQLRLQPRQRLGATGEVHHLSLATATDRWYSGTGATAVRGTFFGYTGRPATGATTLGTYVQGAIDAMLSKTWSVRGSLGVMDGGAVVRSLFGGDRLTVVALESRLTF
jgi:hypothetical protein